MGNSGMLVKAIIVAAFLAVSLSDSFAQSRQAPPSLSPSPALEQLFAHAQLQTDPSGRKWIVSYRWIVPGKEYEVRVDDQYGTGRVTRWIVFPDGSLAGTSSDSAKVTGYFDEAGLPVTKSTSDGKPAETRLEPRGDGFTAVSVLNVAEPGNAPVWKEVQRADRRALSMAEASQLAAQWEQDRNDVVMRPATAEDTAGLRRHLAALAAGQPLYQEMTPASALGIRAKQDMFRKVLSQLGPLESIQFTAGNADGHGLFVAEHANDPALWKMAVDQKGRLAHLGFQPQPSPWGLLNKLAGTTWSDGRYVFYFNWHKPKKILLTYGVDANGDQVYMARFDAPRGKRISVSYGGYVYKSEVLEDGSVFYRPANYLFRMSPTGTLTLSYGTFKDGVFSPAPQPKHDSGTPPVGDYRQLPPDQVKTFNAFVANRRNQVQQSQSGNSGLLGALAMGLGASLAGGNPEQVMGMMMKGAELTTDNEMSRNVLAGQGDAMVADGTQRMIAENARSQGAGAANASSATGDNPGDVGAAQASRGSQPSAPAAGAALSTTKSAQAYFWVGMTPTDKNTRNPSCYSAPFQIQFEHEANGWGDNGRAQEVLKQHEASFIAKCSRHGQVNGVVNGNVESLTSGFPIPAAHSEDFVVQIP